MNINIIVLIGVKEQCALYPALHSLLEEESGTIVHTAEIADATAPAIRINTINIFNIFRIIFTAYFFYFSLYIKANTIPKIIHLIRLFADKNNQLNSAHIYV